LYLEDIATWFTHAGIIWISNLQAFKIIPRNLNGEVCSPIYNPEWEVKQQGFQLQESMSVVICPFLKPSIWMLEYRSTISYISIQEKTLIYRCNLLFLVEQSQEISCWTLVRISLMIVAIKKGDSDFRTCTSYIYQIN